MHSENVKVAIANFFALQGDTLNEKKKSFRGYLKNLSLSSQELDEFADHLLANKPCGLSVDILLHFKMRRHILEIIKSGNGPLVGRILKDWTFVKNIFTCVTPEELVNTVLPLLSFTIRMKIINRVCKTLTDELIADQLFDLLEDKYGITTASVLIPVCSVTLIKSKIVNYDLKLSDRHLWMIYKKDPTFVEYYFAHLVDVMKEANSVVHDYKHLLKRILNSNLILFWDLVDKYRIPIKIGKYSSKKLLTDRDVMLKYVIEKNSSVTFTKRQTYRAAVKLGIQKEYLLSFYPGNLDDFLNNSLNAVPTLQKFVPRNQRFTLTNAIFKEKYSDDLFNYPIYFNNSSLLELLTISERETILDKMENKEDLLYFYGIEKSVPMLKEKLQSASDLKIRTNIIFMLFKTCNVNNSNDDLLDLLNVLYNRYRNDTQIITQFLNSELTNWNKFETLEGQHWDAIYKIINYVNRSDKDFLWLSSKDTYIEGYFKYLVDNDKSTDDLLQTIVNEALETTHMQNYLLRDTPKYGKIFYEGIEKTLKLHSEHGNYKSACFHFLQTVIQFDILNPNFVNLTDYTYILDFCDDAHTFYDTTFVYVLNKLGIFHENMRKYYNIDPYNFSKGFYSYCIHKSPKDLLKIDDVYPKISRLDRNIFDFLNCPFLKDSFSAFKDTALTELNSDEQYLKRDFSMKFLCLLYENEFLNYTKRFDPPEDGKIPDDFNATHLEIQKSIVKCLPLVSYPQNTIILTKYCKGDYLKFALPSLYKILFGTANIHVEDFLRSMYKSAVSVRKHSLCLGRHLLSPKLFGNFFEMVNNQENNLSLRFVFLKKALEFFIETHDDKFYHFFLANLDKVDDKDHSVFDYITKYSKIPKSYLLDYIKQICQKISVNSDKDIKIKKIAVLNSLPDYVFENLDAAFITRCFEDNFFEITPFAIKCLFYSESVDNSQLIFDKFKSFLSGDIRSQYCRSNISGFVQQFCEKALQKKAVDKFTMFYSSCQQAFPEYSLINVRFLIDFTQKWFESCEDVKHFAIKINKYLIDSVKLYTHSIISDYCDQLKAFMANATIDEFEFVQNFFYTNSLDETYIATINLLPNRMPDVKNAYRMYVPLLEALEKIKTPVVIAHLDLYYGRVY